LAVPAIEYDGDMGAVEYLTPVEQQPHFLVPMLNLYLVEQLEVNPVAGFGLTSASEGLFLKSYTWVGFRPGAACSGESDSSVSGLVSAGALQKEF
jgi:hypothetical protein